MVVEEGPAPRAPSPVFCFGLHIQPHPQLLNPHVSQVGPAGSQKGGSLRKEEQPGSAQATCRAVHYPERDDSHRFQQQQKTAGETERSYNAVSYYPVNSTPHRYVIVCLCHSRLHLGDKICFYNLRNDTFNCLV